MLADGDLLELESRGNSGIGPVEVLGRGQIVWHLGLDRHSEFDGRHEFDFCFHDGIIAETIGHLRSMAKKRCDFLMEARTPRPGASILSCRP